MLTLRNKPPTRQSSMPIRRLNEPKMFDGENGLPFRRFASGTRMSTKVAKDVGHFPPRFFVGLAPALLSKGTARAALVGGGSPAAERIHGGSRGEMSC